MYVLHKMSIIINENGDREFFRVQRVEVRWLEGGKVSHATVSPARTTWGT